jgi:hypothetical protein
MSLPASHSEPQLLNRTASPQPSSASSSAIPSIQSSAYGLPTSISDPSDLLTAKPAFTSYLSAGPIDRPTPIVRAASTTGVQSIAAPILPAGPGGFGRHRELVYSRPQSAQGQYDERKPETSVKQESREDWQKTVRGMPPMGGAQAEDEVMTAGGTRTREQTVRQHRPHSFHGELSDFIADPTLFDGGMTATPGPATLSNRQLEMQQLTQHQQQQQQQQQPSLPTTFSQLPHPQQTARYGDRAISRFDPSHHFSQASHAILPAHHAIAHPHPAFHPIAPSPASYSMQHRPALPFPMTPADTPRNGHPGPPQYRHSFHATSSQPFFNPQSCDPSFLQGHRASRAEESDWSSAESVGDAGAESAGEYSFDTSVSAGQDVYCRQYGPPGAMSEAGDDKEMSDQEEYDDGMDGDYSESGSIRRGSGSSRSKRIDGRAHYAQSSYPYAHQSLPNHHCSVGSQLSYGSGPPSPSYSNPYGLLALDPSVDSLYPVANAGDTSDAYTIDYSGDDGTGMPGRKPRRVSKPSKIPAPVPMPGLNKRSRGRHVPVDPKLVRSKKGGNGRVYECTVPECGKCFGRSEHLKRYFASPFSFSRLGQAFLVLTHGLPCYHLFRHIRSLHTNEKPFVCPHPNCTKEFSRHDNLFVLSSPR